MFITPGVWLRHTPGLFFMADRAVLFIDGNNWYHELKEHGVYRDQRQFLAGLERTDPRITTHLGRLEERPEDNPAARELLHYLANLPQRIDSDVYRHLMQIGKTHRRQTVTVEKAVDVMLAVDLVVMAERDEFDAAYVLSRDGDFTPAVAAVREHKK
ncbi:MAG: NYN domain-containing protein [Acidobacteria bacterium]|nr:NYN domain-containing protein [Acidobacteriota bacterium]